MRRRRRGVLATLALAVTLAAGGRGAALTVDEAILPVEAHPSPDARRLAERHLPDLRTLSADLRGCEGALDVRRHGIAFRQPRGQAASAPYLTLWVSLAGAEAPRGLDLPGRASEAFRRYARPLIARLVARSAVFADAGVGGYGVILTWLGPAAREGRPVGESLAIFAGKLLAANFAHDTVAPASFLARSDVRLFDGQAELPAPRLSVDDAADGAEGAAC